MARVDDIAVEAGTLIRSLKRTLAAELRAVWHSLRSHHKDQVQTFTRTVVPSVLGAEMAVADLTADYLSRQAQVLGQEPTPGARYPQSTGALIRRGVEPSEVYARPFRDVWDALDRELDLAEAIERGATRIDQLVDTDLELTHDYTVRDVIGRTRLAGYRRVLVGPTNCALCIVASTQRYRRGDLKQMHPGCNCKVAPIITDEDVHRTLDQELLEKVHREIRDKFGISDRAARKIDYRKIMLVREHGEYGPTLTYRSDRFTGPDDLNRPGPRYDRARSASPGGNTND